jgi:arabinofuranosyltransferase
VAVLALVALAGSAPAIYPAALVINTASVAALILLLGFWLQRFAGSTAALAGTFGLALFPPLWAAAASGLETPVTLLLQVVIVTGTLSFARDPHGTSIRSVIIASVLSVLNRPDGFIIPFFAVIVIFACAGRRPALRLLSAIVAGIAAITAWRLALLRRFLERMQENQQVRLHRECTPKSRKILMALDSLYRMTE